MSSKSFFSVKTQFENLGDALINRELIRLAAWHSEATVDLSRCEPAFAATLRAGVDGVRFAEGFLALLRAMLGARLRGDRCYYYLSPGGYFGGVALREYPSRIANTLMIMFLAMAGIRVMMVGISAERMSPASLRLLGIRRRFVHRLLVRDTLSAQFLAQHDIRSDGMLPDLAFNIYQADAVPAGAAVERVVFSFRTDQTGEATDAVARFCNAFVKGLPVGVPVVCYSHVKRDDPGMRALAGRLGASGRAVSFESEYADIERAQALLGNGALVVSNRLHVLLVGGSTGARVVPVTDARHNAKIQGLFSDLGIIPAQLDAPPPDTEPHAYPTVRGATMKDRLQVTFQALYAA